MIYSVVNNARSPRVFFDRMKREITVAPGTMRHVDLDEGTFERLATSLDITVQPLVDRAAFGPPPPTQPKIEPVPAVVTDKPSVVVRGHFGIGDNLHQRAVMRELMKTSDVWLHTCHHQLYWDLVEQGLKLILRPTSLHAQAKTIARERHLFTAQSPPAGARQFNIGYPKVLVDQHGSILEAMFSCVGLKMPERPDFSLPIKPEWTAAMHGKLAQYDRGGKPLMVHRPIVIRQEWDGRSRNPDPRAYDELYRSIRDRFFVVSVADLRPGQEWIDGPEQPVDVKLHAGELDFPEMAALFKAADLVFCNAGFAPVLAQAVGTPHICVYGGRESYRTTQRVGAHLAPTLPIDPINPCDCHSASHRCDKRIDLAPALARVKEFTSGLDKERTLIFGTFYVDSPDRDKLTDLWIELHTKLNPDCDFLAVDSQSPVRKFESWHRWDGKRHQRMYYDFPDNIGHLSRKNVTQGRDGWGRAFCKGLKIAVELGYSHVAHIEGDSLLRLKVSEITDWMRREKVDVASTSVRGMRHAELERQWVETGLMFMSTDYVKRSKFIERYDWKNRRVAPTPERWIRMSILEKDLNQDQFRVMDWKALRADKNQITVDNIETLDLDWITHQHNSSQQGVYSKFVEMALGRAHPAMPAPPAPAVLPQSAAPPHPRLMKLNLGCGTNKLAGWENHDADVDITTPLPWEDGTASHISIEHCVEHVPYKSAIGFFKEAHRVLAPGGVLRVTVPSLEQIAGCHDESYFRFTTKWQSLGPSKRGAMHAIIYAHGHECAWNARLLLDTLYFAGFDDVRQCETGKSDDPILVGVEGHGRVIGERFNLIESCSCEARKAGQLEQIDAEVAIVIGGGERWYEELQDAKRIIGDARVQYFIINDHIKSFPERAIACTLHPDKLNGHVSWLGARERAGLSAPDEIWSYRKHAVVTHDTASMEWKGSSGLFAVQVARRKGHKKIIGVGVPMTVDDGHFTRHQKWQSAIAFRQGWITHRQEIATCFRSMSGWTAETFGKPTETWLQS